MSDTTEARVGAVAEANIRLIETTSRTALLHARARDITLSEATADLATHQILITACAAASHQAAGQAAFLTAVTLAVRAGLRVTVQIGDPDATVAAGPYRDDRLARAAAELGGQPPHAGAEPNAVLRVGDPIRQAPVTWPDGSGTSGKAGVDLQITWDAWLAQANPSPTRLAERPGCQIAPVAAAALAVSEVFLYITGDLEAGWRTMELSLWNPGSTDPQDKIGPAIRYLPTQWELVGLGHLGQANAWTLSHLPYDTGAWEVWLTDDDIASDANVSTGVLTQTADTMPLGNRPARTKARLVAAALENAGARTRLIERRLSPFERWDDRRPSVALVGVDDILIRRDLSKIGWPLCIDAGLGSTPSSYNSMSVYALDEALHSSTILNWTQTPPTDERDTSGTLFNDLRNAGFDECGVVMLAGRAVAAAFVGMIAACLSISEPLRRLHGGPMMCSIGLNLGNVDADCAPRPEGVRLTTLPYLVVDTESHSHPPCRRKTGPPHI